MATNDEPIPDASDILEGKHDPPPIPRRRIHVFVGRGHRWIGEMMAGHAERSYKMFRLHPSMFLRLQDVLVARGALVNRENVTTTEQLAIFLHAIGHGASNRALCERFQRSPETINRHFNNVLRAVVALCGDYIQLPKATAGVHPRVSRNRKFYPFFQNALGAIDGTHLRANVLGSDYPSYYNRRGVISTNVMACVSFDLQFMFAIVGWEGCASDMQVLHGAMERNGFSVPKGKYYLVDSGYQNTSKFLAPFRGQRYHLAKFNTGKECRYSGPEELFNHRHAQLRNVVERAFKVLKVRWKTLTKAQEFPVLTQCSIAFACCVLHNFVLREQGKDWYFQQKIKHVKYNNGDTSVDYRIKVRDDESARGDALRDSISSQLWTQHDPNQPIDAVPDDFVI